MLEFTVLILMLVGLIDSEPLDDSHLTYQYTQIPSEGNGFKMFAAASRVITDDSQIRDLYTHWNLQAAANLCRTYSAALEAWQAGIEKDRLQVPEVTAFDAELSYLSTWRQLSRLASIQGRLYAEQGNYEKAMRCSLDLIKFGQLQESAGGCLINYLVAIACKTIGIHRMRQIIHDHDVPPDVLVSTSQQLKEFKCDRQGFQNALRIEYTMTGNMIEDIGAGRFHNAGGMLGGDTMALLKKVPMPLLFKKNATLTLFNGTFTDLIENASLPIQKRKKLSYNRRPSGWELVSNNIVGKALYGMLIPSLAQTTRAVDRADIELDFLRLQLAITLYRQANDGNWPDQLSDLTPEWIAELPVDPYSKTAQPYGYSLTKRMIYSVGPDGIDSGGAPLAAFIEQKPFCVVWEPADDPGLLLDETLITRKPIMEPQRQRSMIPEDQNLKRFDENGDGIVDDTECRNAALSILEAVEAKGLSGEWAAFDTDADGILNDNERDALLEALVARLKTE